MLLFHSNPIIFAHWRAGGARFYMSILLKNMKPKEWFTVTLCAVLVTVQVWLDLKLPDYMSEITRLVQTTGSQMHEIWSVGGDMLLCAFGSLIAAIIVGFFAARMAAGMARRLRSELFDKVESFSMEEIGRFSTASLITRSTNDITQIQMLIAMGLQVMIKAPVMSVWAILKIAGKTWEWSLATGCAVFALVAIAAVLLTFALPKFRIVQSQTDKLNSVTRENLTGVRVVRAYNAEWYQEGKFETANRDLTATNLFVSRMMAIMQPGMMSIMNGLTLSIYWIGAYLINAASLMNRLGLFSDMIVYSSYAMQIVISFMMLIMIFVILPRAMVSARRIREVLSTEPQIRDGGLESPPPATGEVEFRHVSFRYPDAAEYVLHDISFSAKPGETVAFIGSTGCGKSTVVNLIPRFYDATEGDILIDGVDVRDYKLGDLHARIGYVPQRAVIFMGTVASNIAFGDSRRGPETAETEEAEIAEAARIAQAAEFVEKLAEGYGAPVSQSGTNLSGGQKQRVAIARAVYRKPEIFIFDDSFSALDYQTDRQLRQELKSHTAGATTFIVAQRIGTIRDADRIVVLDDGNVVGVGTHAELMKTCGVYREIAHSQLTAEELGNE